MARVLVIDGNRSETRVRQVAAGGNDSGDAYAATLRELAPRAGLAELAVDIVRPADAEPELPRGVALADYDGVAITGSALNVYDGGPAVERQLALARAVFDAGLPVFGSCWGLQVAVTVAGGSVRRNPRGRELGFGRRILLNEAGRAHDMYRGKPQVFEAFTIHRDDIERLPGGATELATNEMGLQAASFSCGRSLFWGVQYHPEYSYAEIAGCVLRYGQPLVDEGLFPDMPALEAWVAELKHLQREPTQAQLLWKHGVGPALRDRALQLAELSNWLGMCVLPRARGRGARAP
jgi:GMP synthase (glutamine-hydrolysing)